MFLQVDDSRAQTLLPLPSSLKDDHYYSFLSRKYSVGIQSTLRQSKT
jgi:hypothetical protein